MGPTLCFWYDQRTFNKEMCLFNNFHTNRAKLIEFIQYLSMKNSQILKNDFALSVIFHHEIIYSKFIFSTRIHLNSMNGHPSRAGLLLTTKFATITL
jgi:hypothetical protein